MKFTSVWSEGLLTICSYTSRSISLSLGANGLLIVIFAITCTVEFSKNNISFYIFVADVDECGQHNGGCQYRCINTQGGYICECPPGQRLHTDGRSCIRKLHKIGGDLWCNVNTFYLKFYSNRTYFQVCT